MPPRKKKDDTSVVSDLVDLLKQKEYEAKARRGEVSVLYEVEPVDIDTFIRDPDYLGVAPTYDANGNEIPVLSEPQRTFINTIADFNNGINHVVLWVGKGGGKNWITRLTFMYLSYLLLTLKSPHKYLNFPETEYITFLNVASNAQQAKNNFFRYLRDSFRQAGPKAFKEFGFNPDTDILDGEIRLPKKIQIASGHSQADSLEGLHILVGVADEIDGASFQQPERMWNMLISSSRSRFAGREKIIAISYSRYPDSNGMIKGLYDKYKGIDTAAVFKYPTWEFNPQRKREDLQPDFDRDPDWAEAVYACNPPDSTINAWIKDSERIRASMKDPKGRWPLKFPLPPEDFMRYPMSETLRTMEDGTVLSLDPYHLPFEDWFVGKEGVSYMLVGDPAIGNVTTGGDAYGIVLGHRETFVDVHGKILHRPVIDFVFRFTGQMFKEREIQYEAIHNLIIELKERRGFDIKSFIFDQPFAVELSQWVRKRYSNVHVERNRSANLDDYSVLRAQIFGEAPPSSGTGNKVDNGGIEWFYHPILFWELKNLEVDGKKKRVDHKANTSKDMADPVAVLAYYAVRKWPVPDINVSAGKLNPTLERARKGALNIENKDIEELLRDLDNLPIDFRQKYR